MSNDAFKANRGLTSTGATVETGIICVAAGMKRGGGVQLSGTFVGTVQFEETIDGGTTWVAKTVYPAGGGGGVSSAAAIGGWKFALGGSTHFRARCSAYTSGTIQVDIALTEGVDQVVSASGSALTTTTATIASGASLSAAIDLGSARLGAIQMPAAWTAADLTFQSSADGVTYGNKFSFGAEYNIAAPLVSQYLDGLYPDFVANRYLKIRSGTSGTPVNQGADRVLTLILV